MLDKMTVFFSINKTKKTPGALGKDLRLLKLQFELKIKKQNFVFFSMSKEHKIEKNTNLLKTLLTCGGKCTNLNFLPIA